MNIPRLDNQIVENSGKSLLVDFYGPGKVLVVGFGAYDSMRIPPFEFYGRMKKLEKISGHTLNKILIRDISNSWYHYGLARVGRDLSETISRIRELISRMKPSKVITIGQSMGAFGAILYGALLDVDEVIAFGPMAIFDSKVSYYFSDERWGEAVKRVEASPPPIFHQDLPQLIESLRIRTRFHVYYGTKPTDDPGDKIKYVEAVNRDAVHGFLYSRCARVEAHPVRWSVHRVPHYLRQAGFIDELLLRRIWGLDYSPESFEDLPITPAWIEWMDGNYTMGFDGETLLPQIQLHGVMTSEVVATCFARVRRNVLRREL